MRVRSCKFARKSQKLILNFRCFLPRSKQVFLNTFVLLTIAWYDAVYIQQSHFTKRYVCMSSFGTFSSLVRRPRIGLVFIYKRYLRFCFFGKKMGPEQVPNTVLVRRAFRTSTGCSGGFLFVQGVFEMSASSVVISVVRFVCSTV